MDAVEIEGTVTVEFTQRFVVSNAQGLTLIDIGQRPQRSLASLW